MSFLDKLKDKVLEEFGSQLAVGENTNTSLNLGDFSKNVDKSAQRNYLEEGALKKDLFSQSSKKMEIITQEPQCTVLVKKKMFSSLANNHQLELMSNDEKLFYKASKVLFKKKAEKIANYEKLSKISRVLEIDSSYTNQLLPVIISTVETLSSEISSPASSLFNSKPNNGFTELVNVLERVKTLLSTTNPSYYTKWITKDQTNVDYFDGTGTIELTNVKSWNSTTSISDNSSGSFELVDPYKITYITESDIEEAISIATNSFYNKKIFNFSAQETDNLIKELNSRLNRLRSIRGVGNVSFHINPDTILSKRVRAVYDRIGSDIPFTYSSSNALESLVTLSDGSDSVILPEEYLIDGIYGKEGLNNKSVDSGDKIPRNESELSLFKKIINAIFNKLSLDQNSRNSLQLKKKETNYTRNKMRFSFLGKNIIQPMDEVSIFVSSKSKLDNKILSSLNNRFSGLDKIQSFSSTVYDLKNQFQQLVSPTTNIDLESEKSIFVGSNFPSNIWLFLRNLFISNKDGVCVFSGLAKLPSLRYSDGSYSVSISLDSKTHYLSLGKVNFNPGADNFNGAIFDPITPFKTKFDEVSSNFNNEIPELLDENKAIIGDGIKNTGILKFKAGPGIGQLANEKNIISDISINPRTGIKEKYLYGPDGLVYNWKQGIGVYVAYGNSIDINDPNKVGNQNSYKNPLAGQDVMNAISLIVTGIPYNFITYWRNVQNLEGYQRDQQSNQNSSYYLNLASNLKKSNSIYGNFIPFKNLVVDEQAYAKVLSAEFSLNSSIQELNSKLEKLNDLDGKLSLISSLDDKTKNSTVDPTSLLVTAEKEELIKDINYLKDQINQTDSLTNGIGIVGNNVVFDSDEFINNGDPNKSLTDKSVRRNLRRRLNYMTRRLAWAVRANEDKNLFIVDDTYDKDYDIAAFEKTLKDGNLELYSNNFLDPLSQIKSVANLLNLEFFADSQGHLRVRSPQYNKIPSSVFYRLTELKTRYGVNLYPKFLDNLFSNQLDFLRNKIEILEDQLRLICFFINLKTNSDIEYFITNNSGGGSFFNLLTNESGTFVNYNSLKAQNDPYAFENDETLGLLKSEVKGNKSYFTPANRADVFLKFISPEERSKYKDITYNQSDLDLIAFRIQSKTGQKPNASKYIQSFEIGGMKWQTKSANLFVITEDIANVLSERARTIKLFYETLKNSIDYKQIDNSKTQIGLVSPKTSMKYTPEVLDHLIEDESYDEYGPGSGKRFVIKNEQIISYDCSESAPEYTAVQVNGTIDDTIDTINASDLTSSIESNQGLSSAFAIDYSLMREYGLAQPATINLPFLKDPQAQLAPYASMLLSRARKNILKANMTLIGNEYYQPGDVVYFEELGLLYYVNSVNHNFSYGSSFTTTLSLEYGHVPGDYIPNVTDLVGKSYYNNKDIADVVNYRQMNSFNETNIGIIVYDENASSAIDLGPNTFKSKYADLNAKTIRDIINTVGYQFSINNLSNSKVKATIELRTYYSSEIGTTPQNLLELKENVKQILNGTIKIPEKSSFGKLDFTIDNDWIISDDTVNIDTGSEDPRSPSNKAISMARDIIYNSQGDTFGNIENPYKNSNITKSLYKYIIDCFVKFTFEEENV